jgi:hypothetical protein
MRALSHSEVAEAPIGRIIGQARERAKRLGGRIVEAFSACANAWAAATLYEELSRLSDAELERRGIPHGELLRCVFETLTER